MSKDVREAVRILRDALKGIVIPQNQPALSLILARATLLNAITHITQSEKTAEQRVRTANKRNRDCVGRTS